MSRRKRTAVTFAICVTIPLLIVGCTRVATGPQVNAAAFLSDWAASNWQGMRALTDAPPADFTAVNKAAFADLGVRHATFTAGTLTTSASGNTASEPVTGQLQMTGLGTLTTHTTLHLVQNQQNTWLVSWSPSVIDPRLAAGDHFIIATTWDKRAQILGANGTPLATHGEAVTVGVEGERIKNAQAVASALEQAGATTTEVQTALADAKIDPTFFEPVFTVTMARYQQLEPTIYPIPGTVFRTTSSWTAITPGLANGLVGTMGPVTAQELAQLGPGYNASNVVGQSGIQWAEERQLAGTPGYSVDVVNASGATVATIDSVAPVPGKNVQTTIEPSVQEAAEAALSGESQIAGLVAVNATNGDVLAAATVNAGSYDIAVDGGYPPGSTFKILDSTELIEHGLSPSSAATCPTTITEDGEVFHNAEGDSPVSTMLAAFTESCNTAFIGLTSNNLQPSDFPAVAKQYNIGTNVNLGVASFPGSIPLPVDGADQAATSIGQGRVLVNPLDMAMVAAAVDSGTVREPTLVSGMASDATSQLPTAVVSGLHTMMLSVVQSGTAAGQGLPAGTYAKTGTAEYGTTNPLKLDAWLVGFNGNIAFAALVIDSPGNGGPTCGPIVAKFLDAIGA
jgi:cell division protein FtsI/penicillin-binding protein 2